MSRRAVPPLIHLCHYCGRKFDPDDKHLRPSRDHIVPRSIGGVSAPFNYVWAHARCNTRKGNRWPTCQCAWCQAAIRAFQRMQRLISMN